MLRPPWLFSPRERNGETHAKHLNSHSRSVSCVLTALFEAPELQGTELLSCWHRCALLTPAMLYLPVLPSPSASGGGTWLQQAGASPAGQMGNSKQGDVPLWFLNLQCRGSRRSAPSGKGLPRATTSLGTQLHRSPTLQRDVVDRA